MTVIPRNPEGWAEPAAYRNAIEVPAGARTLYIAGQVALDEAGAVAQGIEAQTRQVFDNLRAILAAAGMGIEDIVKTTVFLVDPDDLTGFVAQRTAELGGHRPTSTLVFVKRLGRDAFRVEVEAIAVACSGAMETNGDD